MTYLSEEFLKRMQEMLGEEYEEFLASYEQPRTYGLRVNTRKMTPEDFEERKIFPVKRIPWVENGFFYEGDVRPAQHPLYAAGAYYLQEPSAMMKTAPPNREVATTMMIGIQVEVGIGPKNLISGSIQ